ncbi:MAG TPA: response regulator [Verrucomicrobiae bacterium]|nr:response regulator [Verrucomicrobiae bacterium]
MGMRPTILVAEPEPLQALSVRKLVLETSKFNVLTAHSTREALEEIETSPAISAAVLVAEDFLDCEQIIESIRKKIPCLPVVVLSPLDGFKIAGADHIISSHDPETLIMLMRELLGDPRTLEGG